MSLDLFVDLHSPLDPSRLAEGVASTLAGWLHLDQAPKITWKSQDDSFNLPEFAKEFKTITLEVAPEAIVEIMPFVIRGESQVIGSIGCRGPESKITALATAVVIARRVPGTLIEDDSLIFEGDISIDPNRAFEGLRPSPSDGDPTFSSKVQYVMKLITERRARAGRPPYQGDLQ